jgi:hypothetical protein
LQLPTLAAPDDELLEELELLLDDELASEAELSLPHPQRISAAHITVTARQRLTISSQLPDVLGSRCIFPQLRPRRVPRQAYATPVSNHRCHVCQAFYTQAMATGFYMVNIGSSA